MARSYSLDLRERVVAAVAAGETYRSVATRFDVTLTCPHSMYQFLC